MPSIRRATPDDATTVLGLVCELAEYQNQGTEVTATAEDFERILARPDVTYLLAEQDGRAVGYVSWLVRVMFWTGEEYLALDDLYVCERGGGIGEQLMLAAAGAADGRLIRWEVAEANEGAQRFYRRIGATLTTKKIARWRLTRTP